MPLSAIALPSSDKEQVTTSPSEMMNRKWEGAKASIRSLQGEG